jgi:replication-associated recombination protein RarA
MEVYNYDHWQKYKTISGIDADLVISAIQKEIRRNHVENATTLAYEMLKTSRELEEYLWQRLRVISVEDVGLANPTAAMMIHSLDAMRNTIPQDGDRGLFAIHAVRYLCESMKDRSSDELYNWVMKCYANGTIKPEIPEYAIDKHTRLGQERKMTEKEFYLEGSKVSPEWKERNTTYRERILEIIGEKE